MDFGIEKGMDKPSPYRKIIWALMVVLLLMFIPIWRVQTKYADKILSDEELSEYQTAIVFGAGLKAKGQPGAVLEDRILTAIKLYQEGKAENILMSGDNESLNHNEVQAMKEYALNQGLPEEIILEDHGGGSTYLTCLRASENEEVGKAVLVTQEYHLKRALYLCNEIGLNADGVVAMDRGYSRQWRYTFREWGAVFLAWLKINF